MTTDRLQLTILCFARLKEITGTERLRIELPAGSTAGDARKLLCQKYPRIEQEHLKLLLARNGVYAQDSDVLHTEDELACFPPVSGG